MKKLILFAAILMGAVAITCRAQTVQFSSDYGFYIATNVAGSLTWTNDNAYSFCIKSLVFNSDIANTATVQRIHIQKENQVVGNLVTTNEMGTVETNYYSQVTNVIQRCSTNIILSVTNSGADVYTTSEIKQIYIHFLDVLKFNFSDTNSHVIMFDTTR